MIEEMFIGIVILCMNVADFTLTYIYLSKVAKRYNNAECLEINWHKHMFKKFGLKKGIFISGTIALIISSLAILFYAIYAKNLLYVYLGIMISAVYRNFFIWKDYDKDQKLLTRLKKEKVKK